MSLRFICCLLFVSNHLILNGQDKGSQDTDHGIAFAKQYYDSVTVMSQHFYNGPRYHHYDSKNKEHQFFDSNLWMDGYVNYQDQVFGAVPLRYDIYLDQLVVRQVQRMNYIQFQSEKVREFTIAGHRFVRLDNVPQLKKGFYDLLHEGRIDLLVRRSKVRDEKIEDMSIVIRYYNRNSFYFRKEGKYYPVNSKKDALAFFGDSKKDIRRQLRKKNLNFKKDKEESLRTMVSFYENLP